jgi:spore coat polysaccharide biosynthesis protein SpsF
MEITAIIQARMGSTRLPGKVLKKICGKPMMYYLITRLKSVSSLKEIIVATSDKEDDSPIVEFCNKMGVNTFCGSENNVLDRYYRTAQKYKVDNIMRITGDCPLIDPDTIEHVMKNYIRNDLDYIRTDESFAEGLDSEIFSFVALKKAWENAQSLSEREHVTLYFNNHTDQFKTKKLQNATDDSWVRITVDEDNDFKVVESIIQHFHIRKKEPFFTISDIKEYLLDNHEIKNLNKSIIRNQGLLKSLHKDH